ncbi:hypothetical protein LZU85_10185 [Vibrio sp. IRLE0018]|uniref:hypothetical protein n=1 Tax=Vibrio floridensis TaxID=2908007 RepID=UPI001A26653A|nr:hypothetical protein [Vibrio floridensis]MCF8779168.1 hypothetical protein [Vibrio floridensis]HAS6347251.1 hypothetical protein [Vibrio vulnificus]
MDTCGKCRHFCRAKENVKDLCGAWEQPTFAKREACGFFMPKARHVSHAPHHNGIDRGTSSS